VSQPAANCPNCGAKVDFRWSSSVQTVCSFCHSILVRTDVDLKRVGQVADLPPDSSPIQIATEGVYRHKPFTVAGRILYAYEQGGWNEWHIVFSDSTSGWLSDAQDEYAVSAMRQLSTPLPAPDAIRRGQRYRWDDADYEVSVITRARYRGTEGELPFEYWDKEETLFADLRSADGHFATLDYSDEQPVLYLGELVEFDDLKLKNLRQFEGW
jgi:Domain of unknown function (DUF4178)